LAQDWKACSTVKPQDPLHLAPHGLLRLRALRSANRPRRPPYCTVKLTEVVWVSVPEVAVIVTV